MDLGRNEDAIRILFKMKSIKKNLKNVSIQFKSIKSNKESSESYTRCLNLFQEGSCYLHQCCGFLKSQYFIESMSPLSKRFLINNLYIPGYKKFIQLRQNLSFIIVDKIYNTSMQILKSNIEEINHSLSAFLKDLNDI